jgi:uracil-DNA glycosylase
MKSIGQSVTALRSKNCVFPVKEEVFNAFRHCSFLDTNVVIIGQDPYHDGSAHGLAFSIREGQTKVPPSLRNILKEVQDDYYSGNFAFKSAHSPTLTRWSEQGVLLLNKTLTVNKGQANSHSNLGWGKFTLDVINKLIVSKIASKKPIVFILWGKESQKLAPTQESDYIKVIKAPHPAAEVYAGGKAGFFGSKPFTQCNEFLEKFSTQEIVW